jgi:hypothetical protein
MSSAGERRWVRLGATESYEQTYECNTTNRVTAACGCQLANKPDTLVTKVMGSRCNMHSCWLFLFVHENVSHTYYTFLNNDVISIKTEYCGVCLGFCISWW